MKHECFYHIPPQEGKGHISNGVSRAQNKGVWSDKNRPSWSFVRAEACVVGHAAVQLSELNH